MNPEARKAFEAFLESIGLDLPEINMRTQHGTPLNGCVGNCMPLNLPLITDPVMAGINSVIQLIGNVKSASYTKGEEEIKIEIVIKVPKQIPSATFEAKGHSG